MILVRKQFFTYDGVSMLGYVCGVSQYSQFYDQELNKYQVLHFPSLGYFRGCTGEKPIKEK